MKLLSKTALLLASLCLLIPILQGCSSHGSSTSGAKNAAGKPGEGKQLVIGLSQIGSESDWARAHTANCKGEAKQRNIILKFSDGQQKQENQIKAVKSFIAQKVDAIILAPVVETGWEPVLREAKAAGIPVILSGRGIKVSDDNLWVTLVASDFVQEGRMAGEFLAKKTNGKCNIVELTGTPGSAPAIDRKTGFEEVIKKYPGMKIIKSQTGDFKRIGGQQVMEAFIKSEGKNINAVYAHNDDMALGAIQALEAAGIKPGKDVTIVSIDGVKAAFEAMMAGKLNATVECTPLLGPPLFDACENAIRGEKQPKWHPSKDQCFDQSVAAKVIGSRTY